MSVRPQIFYPSVLRYFYDFPIIRALRVHSTWVQPRFSSLRRSLTRSLDLVEEFFDHEDHPRWCWLWRYSKRRSDPLTRSSGGVLAQQSLTPRSILPPNPPSSSSSSAQLHPNDIFRYLGAFVLSSRLFHLVCFCSNTLSEIILKYFLRFWRVGTRIRWEYSFSFSEQIFQIGPHAESDIVANGLEIVELRAGLGRYI